MTKSQSVTEHLLIIAVVLVIAVSGLMVVRFVPSMGNFGRERSLDLEMRSLPVGIINYAFKPTNSTLVLKNNGDSAITITNITAHNISYPPSSFPVILYPTDEAILTTTLLRVAPKTRFRYVIAVRYTDDATAQAMLQNVTIRGTTG